MCAVFASPGATASKGTQETCSLQAGEHICNGKVERYTPLCPLKPESQGLPWWSAGEDAALPLQGAQVQPLAEEVKIPCATWLGQKNYKTKTKSLTPPLTGPLIKLLISSLQRKLSSQFPQPSALP